ncbi:actin-like ATPase domain-containing protein [Apiospora rasikravindrae]|uniref:Actin-like ATPase domain-containing protein n=1 Tax=Apiospora rasikravindrae TaxID=990691 RepID=A0ABR1SIZ4_9PEZI
MGSNGDTNIEGYVPKRWRAALDFGTTTTSIVFCLPSESIPVLRKGKIVHVNKWPCETPEEGASRLKATSEIPSVIRYGLTDGSVKIGWDALATIKSPLWRKNPGVIIERFKLLLDTSESTAGLRNEVRQRMMTLQTPKGEVELIADFLHHVFTHSLDFMRTNYMLDGRDDIELVLTLPNAWSPMAVRKMYGAVDMASQSSGLPIGQIRRTVSETEAGMAYVRETSRDVEFETGDCVLMGDIGGGTTDAVPYRLGGSRLVELAPSTGVSCGSTNLDQGFKNQLIKDVKRDIRPGLNLQDNLSLQNKIDLATFEFGKDHKKNIKKGQVIDLWVPFKFREARTADLDKFGEDDDGDLGYYCIKEHEIRSIFNAACKRVWALLKDQLDQVIQLGHNIKMIVLVGGFSESLYLREVIMYECRSYGVDVVFPPKCQWAVVEGAMIWANKEQYQADRISRYSVGIKRHMSYEPRKRYHKGVKPDVDEWGRNYVKNCLEWVIKKARFSQSGPLRGPSPMTFAYIYQGSLIPANGLTKTYDLHISVQEDTPRTILSQAIYISETACEDNYRDSDPVNADAELLETAEFSIEMEPIRHLMTPTKLTNVKRRKTNNGKRTADRLYMVNFRLKITINDLALSYQIECADSKKKAKTGTVPLSYIFEPGTVLRNSTGDVLRADG